MKIKIADIILITVLVIFIGVLSVIIYLPKQNSSKEAYAIVKYDNEIIDEIHYHTFVTTKEYVYQGKLGDIIVKADSEGVWVEKSSCHDKVCVGMGKIGDNDLNQRIIACLPNAVTIHIINEDTGMLG